MKEDFIVVRRGRGERLFEGLLGAVDLLVNERAADLGLLGQRGDRDRTALGLEGQRWPLFGLQALGGTSVGDATIGKVGFEGHKGIV